MGKAKSKKVEPGGAQSHVRARISFLHKAANHLLTAYTEQKECRPGHGDRIKKSEAGEHSTRRSYPLMSSLPRQYISQMRGVSLKSQQRLPVEVKRSFCKRCDLLLVPETTCTEEIRNESRGQRKPWADVRVVRCRACGVEKKFPVSQKRAEKLVVRQKRQNK